MKKIAIASGKGGTGKTTLSLIFAAILSESFKVHLVDCDVENPDCHLFIDRNPENKKEITAFYPVIDTERCSLCGRCQEVCEYNCLLVLKDNVMFFKELCHPCRGCQLVCPEMAVTEGRRSIGDWFSYAEKENLTFDYALMNVGEARANPLIEVLKNNVKDDVDYTIYDAPPGANCPMVETVKGVDHVFLVTEPTLFGLYDLKIAWEVVKDMGIPCSIVINRSDGRDGLIEEYADSQEVEIAIRIPFSKEFASDYSRGIINKKYFPYIDEKISGIVSRI